jgi:hypothetical protein
LDLTFPKSKGRCVFDFLESLSPETINLFMMLSKDICRCSAAKYKGMVLYTTSTVDVVGFFIQYKTALA